MLQNCWVRSSLGQGARIVGWRQVKRCSCCVYSVSRTSGCVPFEFLKTLPVRTVAVQVVVGMKQEARISTVSGPFVVWSRE